jgi:hypothetical protein
MVAHVWWEYVPCGMLPSPSKDRQLSIGSERPALSAQAMATLREGLATCRSKRGLTPEAQAAINSICDTAHTDGWSAEHLLMAVKDACYTSPEIAHLTTTSERDAFLSKIVTACIREFYKADRPA